VVQLSMLVMPSGREKRSSILQAYKKDPDKEPANRLELHCRNSCAAFQNIVGNI
jgi:hypothetical protein